MHIQIVLIGFCPNRHPMPLVAIYHHPPPPVSTRRHPSPPVVSRRISFDIMYNNYQNMFGFCCSIIWRDDLCQPKVGVAAFIDFIRHDDIDVILGPRCSHGKLELINVCEKKNPQRWRMQSILYHELLNTTCYYHTQYL